MGVEPITPVSTKPCASRSAPRVNQSTRPLHHLVSATAIRETSIQADQENGYLPTALFDRIASYLLFVKCLGEGAYHPTRLLVPPRVILPHRALFVHIFLLAGKITRGGMRHHQCVVSPGGSLASGQSTLAHARKPEAYDDVNYCLLCVRTLSPKQSRGKNIPGKRLLWFQKRFQSILPLSRLVLLVS